MATSLDDLPAEVGQDGGCKGELGASGQWQEILQRGVRGLQGFDRAFTAPFTQGKGTASVGLDVSNYGTCATQG